MELIIKKFNGDDVYSWAVFRKKDVKGLKTNVVFSGMATPIISGLSRREAQDFKKRLEKKNGN